MLSGGSWEKGELIRNGNFNQGLESWNIQSKGKTSVNLGTFKTIKGVYENRVAEFIIKGPGMAKIYQDINNITPGLCYELSFFVRNAGKTINGPGIFGAELSYFDEAGDILDKQSYGISNPSTLLVWTYHFFISNKAPTGSKSVRVELYGKVKDYGNALHLLVDDVSLRKI